MKKIILFFASLFVLNLAVSADNDKPIQLTDMPKEAQQFIQHHFANQPVALAKIDADFMDKTYEVVFTNGDQVEFDKKGKWTKVDCEHTQVPLAIVPVAIQQYVSKNYPDAKVVKIELTDRKGYDVDLSNGFEIEFDKKMRVVEIDR